MLASDGRKGKPRIYAKVKRSQHRLLDTCFAPIQLAATGLPRPSVGQAPTQAADRNAACSIRRNDKAPRHCCIRAGAILGRWLACCQWPTQPNRCGKALGCDACSLPPTEVQARQVLSSPSPCRSIPWHRRVLKQGLLPTCHHLQCAQKRQSPGCFHSRGFGNLRRVNPAEAIP